MEIIQVYSVRLGKSSIPRNFTGEPEVLLRCHILFIMWSQKNTQALHKKSLVIPNYKAFFNAPNSIGTLDRVAKTRIFEADL